MKGLELTGLVKRYRRRTVVDGVSLRAEPGKVIALFGPNGAGKTTTFKLALGIERADAGSVRLDGRPLDGLALHERARAGLGYVPQGPSVLWGLTVRQNLTAILKALGKPDTGSRASALLGRYGLEEVADQKAHTLSGGERRRLEFARALCAQPRVLLCDEPFAGVDPLARARIAGDIRRLADDGVSVVLTDHSAVQALETCDEAHLLVDGKVVVSKPPKEMEQDALARRLYLGESSPIGRGSSGDR